MSLGSGTERLLNLAGRRIAAIQTDHENLDLVIPKIMNI